MAGGGCCAGLRRSHCTTTPKRFGTHFMQSKSIAGLRVIYRADDTEAAGIVEEACLRSMQLIADTWGLQVPGDCRVYVMTSWLRFMFDSAPWPWRLLMAVTLPLWFSRIRSLWRYAGGWTQRFGGRTAVGVKPPRLMSTADKSIGERIFLREEDVTQKVRHVTCHELTHAFLAHLRLPSWLNEGLAMVTVDRFFDRPTVRQETLATLTQQSRAGRPQDSARMNLADKDTIIRHYVRGYWIARLLAETDLAFMRDLLRARTSRRELESRIAAKLGVSAKTFWTEVNTIVLSHFGQPAPPGPA